MSELVEAALRRLFQARRESVELDPLPTFDSGGALVDASEVQAWSIRHTSRAGRRRDEL
jgi:hypothetical protein